MSIISEKNSKNNLKGLREKLLLCCCFMSHGKHLWSSLDRFRPPKRLREKQTDKNESGSFVFIESGSKMAVAYAP